MRFEVHDWVYQSVAAPALSNEVLPNFQSVSTLAFVGSPSIDGDDDPEITLAIAIVAVAAIKGGRRGLSLLDAVEHSIHPERLHEVFRAISPAALRRVLTEWADRS